MKFQSSVLNFEWIFYIWNLMTYDVKYFWIFCLGLQFAANVLFFHFTFIYFFKTVSTFFIIQVLKSDIRMFIKLLFVSSERKIIVLLKWRIACDPSVSWNENCSEYLKIDSIELQKKEQKYFEMKYRLSKRTHLRSVSFLNISYTVTNEQ